MSTPGLPKIPSKASVKARLRQYSIEAHKRGAHRTGLKAGCPLCEAYRREDGSKR